MKKSIAIVFAALSVATFGCKEKAETTNPDEVSAGEGETPAEAPAEAPAEDAADEPADDAAAEEGTPADGE